MSMRRAIVTNHKWLRTRHITVELKSITTTNRLQILLEDETEQRHIQSFLLCTETAIAIDFNKEWLRTNIASPHI